MATISNNTFLLGIDVKATIDSSGFAELEVSNGDLAANTNSENIISSINRRLFSEFQELILHDYGGFIRTYVSEITSPKFINLVLIMLENEILKDPRVEDVESLDVEISKDLRRLIFKYSIITISQQKINNIVFQVPINN